MTVAMEPDSCGIIALCGEMEVGCQELVWQELVAALGPLPPVPAIEPFDEAPWVQQHEQIEDMSQVWQASAPLESLIYELAVAAHGGHGVDLVHYMTQQWGLADKELELARGREVQGASTQSGAVDDRAAGEDGADGVVVAGGGGGDVSSGHENGDEVGGGEEVAVDPHVGRPSKVSRRRRAGKAA